MAALRTYQRRFWFCFDRDASDLPPGCELGCGTTAVDRSDAEELIRAQLCGGAALPAVLDVVEDVDVRHLDQRHVVPNMGDPAVRGVWFPRT